MERSRNLSWQFIYRKTSQRSHKDLKGVLFLFRSAARLIVRCCAYTGFISVLHIITRRGKIPAAAKRFPQFPKKFTFGWKREACGSTNSVD